MQKTLHNKIALGRRLFIASDDFKEVVRIGFATVVAFLMATLLAAAIM